MSEKTKKCIKCDIEKSLSMFHKSKNEKDGHSYYCKDCKSISAKNSYKKNCEHVKVSVKNRYLNHREEILVKNKLKKEANKDEYLKQKKISYLKNREKRIAYSIKYYLLNKEKWAKQNGWKKNNKEKANIITNNYRNRKKNKGNLSKDLTSKLISLQKSRCACCGMPLGKDFHLDHIIPLHLGGMNIDTNIQLLRKVCNLRKGHKHPVDYMQSIGMLL